MFLVCLGDNRLLAAACVCMWETQVIAEDGAREFPQFCLWPHSVFTQLLFCVCASVLHTHPAKEAGSVTGTQQDPVKHSELKSSKSNGWRPAYSFILFFIVVIYNSFITQFFPQLEVKGSPNSNLLNTDDNYSKIHRSVVLHNFLFGLKFRSRF